MNVDEKKVGAQSEMMNEAFAVNTVELLV